MYILVITAWTFKQFTCKHSRRWRCEAHLLVAESAWKICQPMDGSYYFKPLDPRAKNRYMEKLACVCLSIKENSTSIAIVKVRTAASLRCMMKSHIFLTFPVHLWSGHSLVLASPYQYTCRGSRSGSHNRCGDGVKHIYCTSSQKQIVSLIIQQQL